MSMVGNVFVSKFYSLQDLVIFLKNNFYFDLDTNYEDGRCLINYQACFKLYIYENHDMDNDKGIDFSIYQYLIIVDSFLESEFFEDIYSANLEISRYLKKLFLEQGKPSIALMDMQRLI